MRLFLSIFFLLFLTGFACAQKDLPLKWDFFSEKVGDRLYDVHLRATIREGWHIFTQNAQEITIGQPTEIIFTNHPLAVLEGKAREIAKEPAEMGQYYHSVDFVQRVKLKAKIKVILGGTVSFQVCTEEQCLFPKPVSFSVELIP